MIGNQVNFCHFSNYLYLKLKSHYWLIKTNINMKASEAIEKIRVLLGVEDVEEVQVQMATATLVDGTVVEVEGELEVGKPLFVQTEEGPIPAPAGKHQTTEDLLITVDEAGVITEIVEAGEEPEVEVEIEMEKEEEKMEEKVDEKMEEEKVKVEMAEKLIQLLEPYLKQIDEMKEKMEAQEIVLQKLSKEPAAPKVKRNEFTNDRDSRVDRLVKLRK